MIEMTRMDIFENLTKDQLNDFNVEKVRGILGNNFDTFQDFCSFLITSRDKITNFSCYIEGEEIVFTCENEHGRQQRIAHTLLK